MTLCECGCGEEVKPDRRFINGHNNKGKKLPKLSEETKKKISETLTSRKHTEETKRNMSLIRGGTGITMTHKSMYENKSCAAYLGIVVGERLCKHLFSDVEMMPHDNKGYDIICNKGMKIDVKTSCLSQYKTGVHWVFSIGRNKIADYFICVAFDNRTDLNPIHMWMIPGDVLNEIKSTTSISPNTVHKWSQWEKDINDAQLCCTAMKNDNV